MKDVPWSDFERGIIKMCASQPSPGKHAAKSAIRHIEKAWVIKDIDKEMAAFRVTTAQEEAVTAIFHALRRIKYAGAERLDNKKHYHKWAVGPFLRAVTKIFGVMQQQHADLKPELVIKADHIVNVHGKVIRGGKDKLMVRFIHPQLKVWSYPIPPFNLKLTDNGDASAPVSFDQQLAEIVAKTNAKTVQDFIHDLAGRRNMLLYARPDRVPTIKEDITDKIILGKNYTMNYLAVYLMIDQWFQKQDLVQHVLDAMLTILPTKTKPTPPDFASSGDWMI